MKCFCPSLTLKACLGVRTLDLWFQLFRWWWPPILPLPPQRVTRSVKLRLWKRRCLVSTSHLVKISSNVWKCVTLMSSLTAVFISLQKANKIHPPFRPWRSGPERAHQVPHYLHGAWIPNSHSLSRKIPLSGWTSSRCQADFGAELLRAFSTCRKWCTTAGTCSKVSPSSSPRITLQLFFMYTFFPVTELFGAENSGQLGTSFDLMKWIMESRSR